jgi:DNA repair protein RecN (Recombination protein N)
MLARLRIDNLAVVESVVLDFAPGLNVLTGSTGAGKSLILGAVNLLMGERAAADVIRRGADDAFVEATFSGVPRARREAWPGLATAGDAVTVARRISRGGRSHAAIDGRPATIKDLRAVCASLLEPHGQNEQMRLRDPESHIDCLDSFAAHAPLRRAYADALAALRAARAELDRFDAELARMREKRELYLHRLEEIDRIAPRRGEKDELEASARLMANAEKAHAALADACAALYDDDASAAALIERARARIATIASLDPRVEQIDEAVEQAAALVAGAALDARSMLEALEFEPADVERVQERLDLLVRLERRYQSTVDAIVADQDVWRRALDGLEDAGVARQEREQTVAACAASVAETGAALSESRRRAGAALGERVTATLQELGMRGTSLRADIARALDPASDVRLDGQPVAVFEHGIDVVRLRIRTNPGESEGALETIASTGELSRVALALKQLSAGAGPAGTTLILDEIDAGVGADLGDALAENLLALASRHQIICITHMPQIAARGATHLVVLKETDDHRTRVHVRSVTDDERTREIARMLGGEEGSERRLALASEMLGGRKSSPSGTRVRP